MSYDAGLVEWAAEAVEPLGLPSARAMMGGAMLYCDGVAYTIVTDDALWFKADKASDADWMRPATRASPIRAAMAGRLP